MKVIISVITLLAFLFNSLPYDMAWPATKKTPTSTLAIDSMLDEMKSEKALTPRGESPEFEGEGSGKQETDLASFGVGAQVVHETHGLIRIVEIGNKEVRASFVGRPKRIVVCKRKTQKEVYKTGTENAGRLTIRRAYTVCGDKELVALQFGCEVLFSRAELVYYERLMEAHFGALEREDVKNRIRTLLRQGGKKGSDLGEVAEALKKIFLVILKERGEDIIKTAVLRSFIRERKRDTRHPPWPTHEIGAAYRKGRATLRDKYRGLPLDIDRYYRSLLWKYGLRTLVSDEEYKEANGGIVTLADYYPPSDTKPKQDMFSNLIHELEQGKPVADTFVSTFSVDIKNAIPMDSVDLIVPVPAYIQSDNKAAALAQALGREFSKKVYLNTLLLSAEIRKQADIPGVRGKIRNVAGRFVIPRPSKYKRTRPAVRGKTVLVVGDFTDTGATLYEAARAICEAGAKRVILFSFGRTVETDSSVPRGESLEFTGEEDAIDAGYARESNELAATAFSGGLRAAIVGTADSAFRPSRLSEPVPIVEKLRSATLKWGVVSSGAAARYDGNTFTFNRIMLDGFSKALAEAQFPEEAKALTRDFLLKLARIALHETAGTLTESSDKNDIEGEAAEFVAEACAYAMLRANFEAHGWYDEGIADRVVEAIGRPSRHLGWLREIYGLSKDGPGLYALVSEIADMSKPNALRDAVTRRMQEIPKYRGRPIDFAKVSTLLRDKVGLLSISLSESTPLTEGVIAQLEEAVTAIARGELEYDRRISPNLSTTITKIQRCMRTVDFPAPIFLLGSTLIDREGADLDLFAYYTDGKFRWPSGPLDKLEKELVKQRVLPAPGIMIHSLEQRMLQGDQFDITFKYDFIIVIYPNSFKLIDKSIGSEKFIEQFLEIKDIPHGESPEFEGSDEVSSLRVYVDSRGNYDELTDEEEGVESKVDNTIRSNGYLNYFRPFIRELFREFGSDAELKDKKGVELGPADELSLLRHLREKLSVNIVSIDKTLGGPTGNLPTETYVLLRSDYNDYLMNCPEGSIDFAYAVRSFYLFKDSELLPREDAIARRYVPLNLALKEGGVIVMSHYKSEVAGDKTEIRELPTEHEIETLGFELVLRYLDYTNAYPKNPFVISVMRKIGPPTTECMERHIRIYAASGNKTPRGESQEFEGGAEEIENEQRSLRRVGRRL